MAVRNRLKFWRHQLLIDTQTEYASLLGVTRQQISLWENQSGQPNPETMIKIWKKLRVKLLDLNLQDLYEHEDLE
ncbi:MAG: helix-turn-helix transcriptional regulator [Syntrophomonas sp.]